MSVPAPQGRSLLTSGAGQGLRGLPMSHGRAELVVVAAGPVVAAAPPRRTRASLDPAMLIAAFDRADLRMVTASRVR